MYLSTKRTTTMEETPVIVFAKWHVQEGHLAEVLSALEILAQKSRLEEGNLLYNAFQALDNEHIIYLYEVYRTMDAIKLHRQTEHFQEWALGKIIPLLSHREVTLTRLCIAG